MSKNIQLKAESRERVGKGSSRAERRSGFVPAVIYGDKKEAVSVKLPVNDLLKEMHKPGFFSHVIDLEVGKDKHSVIAKDYQMHPVTDLPLHVDFYRVSEKSIITVEIPIHFEGESKSPGLKRGGVLNIVSHSILVKCPASAIPESYTVSIEELNIGDSVHVSDIELGDKVESAATTDMTIAVVSPPKGGLGDSSSDEEGEDGEEAASE